MFKYAGDVLRMLEENVALLFLKIQGRMISEKTEIKIKIKNNCFFG